MHKFWEDIIKLVFEEFGVKNIVEIGSEDGKNTFKIIKYVSEHKGFLYSIDPSPLYDYKELEDKYPSFFKQYLDLSLNVLGDLKDIDAVLIDGDHNWYTVFNELKLIDEYDKFPIIFLHDVAWPYARRDLYYNPDNIPVEYRKPYSKKGLIPGESKLNDIGVNNVLFNANFEGGEENGVLTAIEDFIKYTKKDLVFYSFDFYYGLGVLITEEKKAFLKNNEIFCNAFPNFLKEFEKERNNLDVNILKLHEQLTNQETVNIDLNNNLENLNIELIKMQKINEETTKQINDITEQIKEKDGQIKDKNELIKDKNKRIKDQQLLLKRMKSSKSWKITKPFRNIGIFLRKIKK